VYQLGLQVAVMLLGLLKRGHSSDLRSLLHAWLGEGCSRELDWICDSVQTAMKLQMDVEIHRRQLRMPVVLAEPSYVRELRQGAALRALRRVGVLARLNRVVEDCFDSVLTGLGHEALGKRGCTAGDLTALDPDLKSRLVTTEELGLVIGSVFRKVETKPPASWWDRSCDIALVIGSFVHGLGNYEAMRSALDLPFADMIFKAAKKERGCAAAAQVFLSAAEATRRVFDDALESARIKAELEVQTAVAAALKASSKREEDAAVLRKGGVEAEAVISSMPDTQVEDAFAYDGTDSHFVTLDRMLTYVHTAVYKEGMYVSTAAQTSEPILGSAYSKNTEDGARVREHELLPMPDARVLDHRLLCVLNEIESEAYSEDKPAEGIGDTSDLWIKSNDVQTNIDVRTKAMLSFVGGYSKIEEENSGIGLGGNQCGSSHRTLNDGSDFGFGSASTDLAHVAYGTDAPRYLRALGVPMNVTRFAVTGLVYANAHCVKALLVSENLRYYGTEDVLAVSRSGSGVDPSSSEGRISTTSMESRSEPESAANPDGHVGPEKIDMSPTEALVKPEKAEGRSEPANVDMPAEASSEPTQELVLAEPEKIWLTSTMVEIESEAGEGHAEPDKVDKQDIPNKPLGIDPTERMNELFRQNAKLRANVCLAVLLYGFPSKSEACENVHPGLSNIVLRHTGGGHGSCSDLLFDGAKFRECLVRMEPDLDVPEVGELFTYVENFLMPHCLLLCINGNGATTRNARGSRGDYATAFGVSVHPEPSQPHPSPIPDPCLGLHEHSLEALGHANALLRRVRLLRSCVFLGSGKEIPVDDIVEVVRSDFIGHLEDMPVWWSPNIHDVALLVQAASEGLFSVIPYRLHHAIFSPKAVQESLYSLFVTSQRAMHPINRTSPEIVAEWARTQSAVFPSLNQLERRLAFLCSSATAQVRHEARFENVPMFDHGGWPRN
jgi:hypothetical protein